VSHGVRASIRDANAIGHRIDSSVDGVAGYGIECDAARVFDIVVFGGVLFAMAIAQLLFQLSFLTYEGKDKAVDRNFFYRYSYVLLLLKHIQMFSVMIVLPRSNWINTVHFFYLIEIQISHTQVIFYQSFHFNDIF